MANMGHSTEPQSDSVGALTRIPASDVKRRGWRGVMTTLGTEKALVVTNHDRPEAVILATEEYSRLMAQAARAEAQIDADLAALRRRFDERLASLRAPGAGDRLRVIMRGPARLRGKVKAGARD
jgi:PHD/YefM family antitoxin component YafN of YafNO toxin-antitoxin module